MPGHWHLLTHVLFGGIALFGIWTYTHGLGLQLALTLIPFVVLGNALLAHRYQRIRLLHSQVDHRNWTIEQRHRGRPARTMQATLIAQGYKSAALLVLVFQTDNGYILRLPIWFDQVAAQQYSYLNAQLAFNTVKPDTTSRKPVP